ncbi:DUF4330 family protein [Candidatus Omnitrophota bacterium]
MKIIDKQGRLFGKINVIDFAVILFLLSITPMFYYGYKLHIAARQTAVETRPRLSAVEQEKRITEVIYNFVFDKLESDVLKLISVGDKEIDEKGQAIGEILHLEKPEPLIYEITTRKGKKRFKKSPVLNKMSATLKVKVELRQDRLHYKDKPVLLNSPIDFKTDKYQVEAICVSEKVELGTKPIKVKQIGDIVKRIDALANQTDDIIDRINALEKKRK